jgi:hypothetical protein
MGLPLSRSRSASLGIDDDNGRAQSQARLLQWPLASGTSQRRTRHIAAARRRHPVSAGPARCGDRLRRHRTT